VSESNLARSLFSASKDPSLQKKPPSSSENEIASEDCDRKLQALNLEVDILQQNVAKWEAEHRTKCEYIELLENELAQLHVDRDRRIQELTAQVEQAETMVQYYQAAWEQEKQELMASLEAPRQQDLQTLAALEAQIVQLQAEKVNLEAKQQRLTAELEIIVRDLQASQQTIQTLQAQTDAAHSGKQKELTELQLSQQTIQQLQKQLNVANVRKEELEAQLAKQNSVQARLQQSLQLVEAEHATTKSRLQDLEQQTIDLQEQVLQQACQTAEYEAAIQHWKDKAMQHQRHALQLSGALDRFLEPKGSGAEDVKKFQPAAPESPAIAEAVGNTKPSSPAIANLKESRSPNNSKVDLPAFLVRQR
jgi:chromosome segregation ATPase